MKAYICDGLIDSISYLLCDYYDAARNILQIILNVFGSFSTGLYNFCVEPAIYYTMYTGSYYF